MKITRRQLRRVINEALEIHLAPEDLDRPEETYRTGGCGGETDDSLGIEDLIRALDLQNDSEFSEFLSPPPAKRRSGG